MMILEPAATGLDKLQKLWQTQKKIRLDPKTLPAVEAAAALVQRAAAGEVAIYGINTGFGKLASIRIAPSETGQLQRNLVLSHCCGVGPPLDAPTTRLMMILKLLSLGRGASGVRPETIQLLEDMINHDLLPVIPVQGSVGASGDLAPLAHLAAGMIGEGAVLLEGRRMTASRAFAKAGLKPVILGPKEGLALINGTQFSTALGLAGLFRAMANAETALVTAALSTDAIMGSTTPLLPQIHALRGHAGQQRAAATMRALLEGSAIRESHREGDNRVQDPYCIRCQPQVAGAAMDALDHAAGILQTEANAVTDNPLVLTAEEQIVSGGNFHAEPVGFAADIIALAIAEIGAIAQRRIAILVDPNQNHHLPAFLSPDAGLNSGFMIAEVTSAALMSENKHLANPCVTDSTPTSANQEDHVSMAAHGARRLGPMNSNLSRILGIELVCAAQGVEWRKPLNTGPRLVRLIDSLRQHIAPLQEDRALADELELAGQLVEQGMVTRWSEAHKEMMTNGDRK